MGAEATGKVRGLGDGRRMKVADLRVFGRWKRVNRHDIPDEDSALEDVAWLRLIGDNGRRYTLAEVEAEL